MASNVREKGNKFCFPFHPKEDCTFLCEDCDIPVCDVCISTTHKRHSVVSLKIAVQEKYNFIQDFDNSVKSENIPQIKDEIKYADDSVENMKKRIDKGIQEIETHRQYIKDQIDFLADQTVSHLNRIRDECIHAFVQFKADSDQTIKKLEDLMKSNKQVTRSDNNVLITDTAKELSAMKLELVKFGKCPDFELKLGTCGDSETLLKQVFGFVSEVAGKSTKSRNTGQLTKHLLSNPKVIYDTTLSFKPRSFAVTRAGTVWMHESAKESLYSMDQNQMIRELVTTGSLVDISVNPHTDVLYCLSNDESINTVDRTNENLTKLFIAEGDNMCLAITKDGHLLVGDYVEPMVTLYTERGRRLQTFTYQGTRPYHISVCMSTGMVALSCGRSGLLVLDSDMKKMYTYMGPETMNEQPYTTAAVFDDQGHLLVLEYELRQLSVINAITGQHLKTIPLDNGGRGICLALKQDGVVLVGTSDPNAILTIKYMEKIG